MAKYRKKPVVVEAKPFKNGMEDGYACYNLSTGEFVGFYHKELAKHLYRYSKNGPIPKFNMKPAIKTLEGWYEVEEGKHYIVTGVKGERYPVEIGIFEETYELVEEEKINEEN